MSKTLTFHIGKETGDRSIPPFRAYFVWLDGDRIFECADFSESQLKAELGMRTFDIGEKAIFETALKQLQNC